MNGFELGDKVTISSKYVRHREGRKRVWKEVAIPDLFGVYIGHRTLQNGHVEGHYDEWVREESVTVALVVTGISANAFPAPYKSLARKGL